MSSVHDGRPRVFMDNPAGTQLPRRIVDAVSNALVEAGSNYGGFFETSRNAEAIYADVGARAPSLIVVIALRVLRILPSRFGTGAAERTGVQSVT